SELVDVPFDERGGVIRNVEGRVVDVDGDHVPGLYTTGWIKRGPVGLIGHTKSDASETIAHLVADAPNIPTAPERHPQAIVDFLASRDVQVVEWDGWLRVNAHEASLGEATGRARIKVVPRDELTQIALGEG